MTSLDRRRLEEDSPNKKTGNLGFKTALGGPEDRVRPTAERSRGQASEASWVAEDKEADAEKEADPESAN